MGDIETMEAGREMDSLVAEMMGYDRHHWNALYGTVNTDYCLKCGQTKRRGEILSVDADFCKTVPLHYSTDIAEDFLVHQKACTWIFSKRRKYFEALNAILQGRVHAKGLDLGMWASYPDVLMFLEVGDFSRAALKTVTQ